MIPIYKQLFVILTAIKVNQPQSHSLMKKIYLKVCKKLNSVLRHSLRLVQHKES